MSRSKRSLEEAFDEVADEELQSVPKEATTLLAKLCDAYVAKDETVENFLSLCEDAGFRVAASSLRRWRLNVRSTGEALPGGEQRGRKRELDELQERLFVGWVLRRNNKNKKVDLDACIRFIKKRWNKPLVESTVHEYLTRNGFSSKKMKKKVSGYHLTQDALVDMAFEWLRKHWRLIQRGEVWSIDCKLTGHRTRTVRGYALKGLPPPLSDEAISRFTNLIVTAISSLGRRYPAILFTYNQLFRRDRNDTPLRRQQVAYLDLVLTEYEVASNRIIYCGKDKGETRTYVAASADIIQMYLDSIELEKGDVFFSDNGKEFFPKGGSILEANGLIHVPYPAPVHQYLSANDNNHHSAAAGTWHGMKLDFRDDVRGSVALLHCFDNDQPNYEGYFETNLQCGFAAPDKERVRTLIGGTDPEASYDMKRLMYDYCIAFKKDGRGSSSDGYADDLDGIYWQ